ncbi:MAG TPA: CBS domain-containing protein [Pyrinomonadaceae bacterium]|nr:CBS domain-containing protein [Pyrinomonadaceae bacterium]
MKCREVLTENPVFCLPDETVGQVARLMRRERVGSVPVVTDEQRRELVGIVTDQDLAFKVVGESRDLDRTTVFDIMTRAVVACRDDDEVDSAIRAMAEHEVRRIPIVNYAGRLVGIISQGDVALRIPLLTAPTHHLWRVA